MRQALVVGNWKMNGSLAANSQLLESFLERWQGEHQVEVAVCPPAIYLAQVKQLAGDGLQIGAQDVSQAESGAYTGEVSASMVADLDCRYAIVGHSERREYHSETNELVAEKFAAAQQAGLVPILCVGETLEQRNASETLDVIAEQLKAVIDRAGLQAMTDAVVAYEPVWAIGTGLTATPEQAQEVHGFIREQLGDTGDAVRILYGGSVKPANAGELFAKPDIDGALVGGASLASEDFYQICLAAE
ncbi:triose-phosphate isomerase [Pseudomaricurvus alkylphenolicus]|uniref:triose-phosphate isomerase n=1 Tax=Pseudomaricurvus alkylphenolicus TaxID=1306991 RepID=UPI00141EA507|nr:triose-phosphate isomerase [Pseudomaricurvus alkylphenolicus]NIB44294.1 triose-phosphate isomerase [Pseudomaricurvus alkylphenolicus]